MMPSYVKNHAKKVNNRKSMLGQIEYLLESE
jgi:hypothetical protein